jgi:hypothetical protein
MQEVILNLRIEYNASKKYNSKDFSICLKLAEAKYGTFSTGVRGLPAGAGPTYGPRLAHAIMAAP